MLGYWCEACQFMYRELELNNRKCPECKAECKPRLVLGSFVIGG